MTGLVPAPPLAGGGRPLRPAGVAAPLPPPTATVATTTTNITTTTTATAGGGEGALPITTATTRVTGGDARDRARRAVTGGSPTGPGHAMTGPGTGRGNGLVRGSKKRGSERKTTRLIWMSGTKSPRVSAKICRSFLATNYRRS